MYFFRTMLVALLMAGTAFAQTPPQSQKTERASADNEELALAALEGLMAQPAARALPIVKKVLAGQQSTLVKKRALFVLSQIDGPEARELLLQTSRSADAEMRGEAIRSIGIGGDPKALESLKAIYSAGSADVKSEVLKAWLIAGDKEAVYQVALNAKTEDEATEAIRLLGAMGASDELRKLADRPNAARGLLEAFAISGDLDSLRKIAEGSGERSVRLDAVRNMGIVNSDAARTALRDIYSRSTDAEIKESALQGLMISGDDEGVLALYRAAKTSDEKRSLLRMLATMDSDAALQAIDAALENK